VVGCVSRIEILDANRPKSLSVSIKIDMNMFWEVTKSESSRSDLKDGDNRRTLTIEWEKFRPG
jgi:hypothetical protein